MLMRSQIMAACLGAAQALVPACTRHEPPEENVPPAAASSQGRKVALELDGIRVEVTLPNAWQLRADQSDQSVGMVAFAPEFQAHAEQHKSAFLDGSRGTNLPASVADAVMETLSSYDCKSPTVCRELGRATLPNGGVLVTIKKPHAVYVEAWRSAGHERVVRCGAEVSDLGARGKSWLDDEQSVQAARANVEALCRSVTPLP
jgi:hypothetical protein